MKILLKICTHLSGRIQVFQLNKRGFLITGRSVLHGSKTSLSAGMAAEFQQELKETLITG